jgi:hypothetical protein
VVAIIVATFSAVAAFVLIALVAVYYIVENTPSSPEPQSPGDDTPVLLRELSQIDSCH